MSDIAARALRLLESCQMPGYDPEGAETYPAVEDGGVNSIGNALAAAQVLASLAVADELRRLNEGRDQWYREVLEVLSAAKAAPAKQCWKTKRGPQPVVGEAFIYRCVLELGHDGKCTDGERMEWK